MARNSHLLLGSADVGYNGMSWYTMSKKCPFDPICEWMGPSRLLQRHGMLAHGVANKNTIASQRRTATKRGYAVDMSLKVPKVAPN